VAFVRTVRTASGATAVQIVWSWRRGSRSIEHIGSAHDAVELAALKTAAAARLAAGQTELDLGLSGGVQPGALPIISSRMSHLWSALCAAYRALGFELVAKGDTVFRDLVLARVIEPTSKLDAARVLTEVGVEPASYATVNAGCRSMPNRRGANRWPGRVHAMPALSQRRWSCSTCPLCTSKPMRPMGSASPASPRNAAWTRRSPSVCSPMPGGSR
jgi:hypothetical protein